MPAHPSAAFAACRGMPGIPPEAKASRRGQSWRQVTVDVPAHTPLAHCRPYAAYANHGEGGALEFVWGGDFPLLRLRRDVRAGEELCVDYGPWGAAFGK